MLHRIAVRLGKFVSEVERECNYEEVLRWNEFFEHEIGTFEKSDYYLAQIACVIAQANSTKRKQFKINDFLIKFDRPKAVKIEPAELAKRVCSWFGITT